MSIEQNQLKKIVEAALMAVGQPLNIDRIISLFEDSDTVNRDAVRQVLTEIAEDCESRGVELKEVGSGFRFQAKQEYSKWLAHLWEERPPKYSRALLETLVLIAYRQPVTRGEIEEVRGVSVSTHIIKSLQEREWVRVVGHRDVPGKPALYATTKAFLDYFNLKSLEELPALAEIKDLDKINVELPFDEQEQQDVKDSGEIQEEAQEEAQGEEAQNPEIQNEPIGLYDNVGEIVEVILDSGEIQELAEVEYRAESISQEQSLSEFQVDHIPVVPGIPEMISIEFEHNNDPVESDQPELINENNATSGSVIETVVEDVDGQQGEDQHKNLPVTTID